VNPDSWLQAVRAHLSADRVVEGLQRLPNERLAFSEADVRGRVAVAEMMSAVGLSPTIDTALNVRARTQGRELSLPPIIIGSHVDTVPAPGLYDGALGVLCGIECARAFAEAGYPGRHPLELIAFSDEEGSVTMGTWGSRVLTAALLDSERHELSCEDSALRQTLTQGERLIRQLGMRVDPTPLEELAPTRAAAYLELHIEQGALLKGLGAPTGAVTGIVGVNRYLVTLRGVAGHAGTVPMRERRNDVVWRVARLVHSYWSYVESFGPDAVMNIGDIDIHPGSFNVIPDRAALSVEFRSLHVPILEKLERRLLDVAGSLGGEVEVVGRDKPVSLAPEVREATLRAAAALDVACAEIPSWAGHDAMSFAPFMPTGMVFVRNTTGASHCEQEAADRDDIQAGLELLAASVMTLDAAQA
jgi:hydantoinase/carbamoylase family amidase